jgi:sterol desaturase/sphingolipid hydroxylase (fatty acid hydroxylase superfamily)
MNESLLQHEGAIRLACFAGIFAAVALWEWLAPRRALTASKAVRWVSNLAIVAINTALLRVAFPLLAVGMAALAAQRGWGLLNQAALPEALAFLLSVLALDGVIYLQHVMFHAVPALWRLHRMHHTDLDFDVTTGARFHPIEIALSMGIKLAAVVLLGPPPGAVLLFEVLLNGTALFNHGNVRLPLALDRWLRLLVVTPDMHRVHHSWHPEETNSNFGFNLPWWDRLCGTYRAQPRDGHTGMTIGIDQFREPRELWLHRLLLQPFRGAAGRYAINAPARRGGGR